MRNVYWVAALLGVVLVATCGGRDAYAMSKSMSKPIAIELVGKPKTEDGLDLHSPGFAEDEPIPLTFSAYGDNRSPRLDWNRGPAGTRSYALLLEDPDAPSEKPFVHWVIYNLPATTTSLPAGLPENGLLSKPEGAVQGSNSIGGLGYFGPRPPAGPAHHYHFQLFALDTVLPLHPGADRAALVASLKGHVLAESDLVGTFEKP